MRKDIPFRKVEALRPGVRDHELEALAVEIRLGKGKSFTCTNVYRPPVREGGHADLGVRLLRVPSSNFLLAGDFNAHHPLWDDNSPTDRWGTCLEEWAGDNDLATLNDGEGTRCNRATGGWSSPDVTLVHTSLLPKAQWWCHQILGSDHVPIFCEVEVNPSSLKEEHLKLKWNFREADWEGFRKDVDESVDAAVPRSRKWKLTRRVTFFEDAVLGAAKRHVGMVRAKGSGRCWMTPALREATNRRNRLGRDLVRNRERWLEACREVRSLTREAKTAS